LPMTSQSNTSLLPEHVTVNDDTLFAVSPAVCRAEFSSNTMIAGCDVNAGNVMVWVPPLHVDVPAKVFAVVWLIRVRAALPATLRVLLKVAAPVTPRVLLSVVAPVTPSVPPTVSLPVTPRVDDSTTGPVTASEPPSPDPVIVGVVTDVLNVVALRVAGIIAAVRAQAVGVAVDPVQFPRTVLPACVAKSAGTRLRNNGAPVEPLGEANMRFWDCDARVAVRLPALVIGETVTVNIDGSESPTEVTPLAAAKVRYA
jgi:hypothetical protein